MQSSATRCRIKVPPPAGSNATPSHLMTATVNRAHLTVDLDALAHNLGVLRAAAPGAEVAAVVKADAYGLGVGPVGRRLASDGVRSFFVARLAEGEALRAALGDQDLAIHVFDGLTEGSAEQLAAAALIPVLNTPSQVAAALAAGATRVALQVDTGMNRLGLTCDAARAVAAAGRLDVALLVSHLGSATDPAEPRNAEQLRAFREIRALFPGARASLAASAGAFLGPDFRYDQVRAGISLFGGGPEERPDRRLRAVATLTAPILDIRELQAGDRVGYGEMFTAARPMRIAVVGAGYADGFLRAAAGKAQVWCAGALRTVLTVNMDLMTIDLGTASVSVGGSVQLLGPKAPLDDLAAAAGTVAHEVLVRLGQRAERAYVASLG